MDYLHVTADYGAGCHFFVTSSDSGSLVIDIITSGGAEDPPVWQRVFWAISEGVVAAVRC